MYKVITTKKLLASLKYSISTIGLYIRNMPFKY